MHYSILMSVSIESLCLYQVLLFWFKTSYKLVFYIYTAKPSCQDIPH